MGKADSSAWRNKQGDLTAVAIWFRGNAWLALPGGTGRVVARFGGEPQVKVGGLPFRSRLQHVLTISAVADAVDGIPLLYGFQHEGCFLEYCYSDSNGIRIEEVDPPRRTSGWPYSGYPHHFPESDLHLLDTIEWTFGQFLANTIKRSEFDESFCHIVVPPLQGFGVSLWGEEGDAEWVQTIFAIDPTAKMVYAESQCS